MRPFAWTHKQLDRLEADLESGPPAAVAARPLEAIRWLRYKLAQVMDSDAHHRALAEMVIGEDAIGCEYCDYVFSRPDSEDIHEMLSENGDGHGNICDRCAEEAPKPAPMPAPVTHEVEGFWPAEVQAGFSGLVFRCRKCTGGFTVADGLPDDAVGGVLRWMKDDHERDCQGRKP